MRSRGAACGVVDIGFVVERMVGILAVGADAVEKTVGLVAAPRHEGRIAHADVVLLPAARRERPVIDRGELAGRGVEVALRAVPRSQRETHVVAVDRSGPLLHEAAERSLGLGVAQLHGAGRQVVIDRLAVVAARRAQDPAGTQEFVAGIAPAPRIEEFGTPVEQPAERLRGFGRGREGPHDAPRGKKNRQNEVFAHIRQFTERQR